jgi:uncharacterized protein with von Willebrand factor type A (vWA) domain
MDDSRVPLKEYFEAIIKLNGEAQDKAMELYREEIERRLQGLNELRKEVTEDRGEFVKRDMFDLSVKEVRSQLDTAKVEDTKYRDRIDTRFGDIENKLTKIFTWGSAIVFFIFIVNLIIHYFK